MFGWRKRNQGFEWRQYVRTTILVRRQQRREKLDEVRQAADVGRRAKRPCARTVGHMAAP